MRASVDFFVTDDTNVYVTERSGGCWLHLGDETQISVWYESINQLITDIDNHSEPLTSSNFQVLFVSVGDTMIYLYFPPKHWDDFVDQVKAAIWMKGVL